ncbi:MAG: PAS domain S-box protein [Melioribacteraceae bacterium]|nr:PAS domain S-box protein [Melioribacteraceae bacterium]
MGKKRILPQNINSRISDLLKTLTDEEGGNNQEVVELLLDIQKQNTQLGNNKLPAGEIVSPYSDVTEQKQAEQIIELSEMNLKSLINNRKEAIWSIDNEYNYIIFNDFFKELYYKTYKIKLEVGINALDLLTGELYDFWKVKYDRALSGEKYSFEFKAKSGKNIHHYEVSLNPIISQKKITGVSALSIDITERKRTIEALIESEEKYKIITESSSDVIFFTDNYGKILFVNESVERVLGFKKEEIEGKTFKKFVPRKEIPKYWSQIQGVFLNKENKSFITKIYHKDGHAIDVEINVGLIKHNGKLVGRGNMRDITERVSIEKVLKESEENYKGIFNTSSNAIYIQDKNGVFIDVNVGAEEMYGYKRSFFIGKTPEFISAPGKNDLNAVVKAVNKAYNGEEQKFEYWGLKKNGEVFPKDVKLYSGNYNGEKVVIAVAQDISERKEAEKALRESEEKYRVILNSTSDYLFTAKISGKGKSKIDWVGGSFKKITGFTFGEYLKRGSWAASLHPEDVNIDNAAFEELIQNRRIEVEVRTFNKKGEIVWVRCSTSPVWSKEENRVVSIYGAVKDITEEKNAELAIQESEAKYRLITNLTSDYLFSTTIDENGNNKPTWVGGSFEKITGYTFEEYKKNGGWCAALHPDDVARDRVAFKQLSKNENVKLEVRTFNKSGEIVWVETFASPIWDKKKNKLIGINGACTDITKEKLASIALKKSEEKYKLLSLVTSDYVFETEISEDGVSELIWVGGSFEEITGYRFEEYKKIGGWRAVIHPDDIKIDDDAFKENLANETVSIEVRTYHKNGNIIWVRAFGYPHWDYSKNRLAGILGSVKDITKEKEALLALQEREEKYKLISNITSDYLFESKFNKKNILKTIWVAGSFKEMTGYTLEEYQKAGGWSKLLFREDIAIDAEALEELKQNRKTVVELRTHHKDGRTIWVKNSCSPIWDKENNKILGVIGAVKDITEEKQNQIIHEIQYNIANAIVNATNTKELFSKVREELNKILNTTNFLIAFYDEKTGMFLPDIDKDEKDDIKTWSAEKSISGLLIEKKKRLIIKKEEILELASSGKIDIIGTVPEVWLGVSLKVRDKVIGVMAVQHYTNRNAFDKKSVDLFEVIGNQLSLYLERNRAKEDALRLSRAIVQSPVSIAITNLEGEIEYVNPKFEKVSGYTFEEVIGETTNILKSDTMSKEFYQNLWNTILGGNDWRGEFLNKRKDGGLYWENAVISPIENDSGEITHFVAIKEDITEKKKMIEELIASKEKAEVSEKIKTEFLAQMSHEIRSPLNVILSFVGLLKEDLAEIATEEMMQSFESIDSASTRITRTIDLILNMTDLQLGSYESTIEEIDVIETLDRIKSEYNHSAIIKGLELRQSIQFNRKKISSDKYALVQIISNLVDNAIKYSDSGFIEIFADNNEKRDLVIKVKDTGIGISKEFLPEIFNSFSQEEQGYTRSYDGNGLGMALVKKYCDIISADISVKSKKGKGTTFTLVVPSLKIK